MGFSQNFFYIKIKEKHIFVDFFTGTFEWQLAKHLLVEATTNRMRINSG